MTDEIDAHSPLVRFTKEIRNRLKEHDILTYSASLAFYTLLSFIPLIFIGIALTGEIIGNNSTATREAMELVKDLFPQILLFDKRPVYRYLH